MAEEGIVEKAERLAEATLGSDFAHGFPHVVRVRRLAWDIVGGEGLEVDKEVLDLAVFLHDVGRRLGEPHALYSAYVAEGFLARNGLKTDKIELVLNAILYHSYSFSRSRGIKPFSVEAKVLSDADKLDALGVVGFLRVFLHGSAGGRSFEESLRHFEEKIFRLRDLMHFDYSRKLASELEERTRKALDWLMDEMGGFAGSILEP